MDTSVLSALHSDVKNGELKEKMLECLMADSKYLNECEVLDFKEKAPSDDYEYAKLVRDLVAFHNSYGGFVVIGVREVEKDTKYDLVGVGCNFLQQAKLRDMLKNYTGVDIRFFLKSYVISGINIESVWVSRRIVGEQPVRFVKNGPNDSAGKPIFKRSQVVFRRIDNNAIAQVAEDYDFLFSGRRPPSLDFCEEDYSSEPLDNNLPERSLICSKFVGRDNDIGDLWVWMADGLSRVKLIAGEGGLGKTSLAYKFSEEVANRKLKPFNKILWLTAKKKQFIPSEDKYRNNGDVNFSDADSLFKSISSGLGCIEEDFVDLNTRELMQLAIDSCSTYPCFLIIDDVDSLTPEDQQRALEFGLQVPLGCKVIMTTRVNLSYSPDNLLKLGGFSKVDFYNYVDVLRTRYGLSNLKTSKVDHLLEITGGSPLFTDSLIRLERRGLTLDQAMSQWKDEKGMDARKAALEREVSQLSRFAKRTLYAISVLKNIGYVELKQILDYTDQTLGDAIQELSGLFLINAPRITEESRYTVEPNTGLLVLELSSSLAIDHAALLVKIKRNRSDAIGLTLKKRHDMVGLAIAQANSNLKGGDPKAALETVLAASKRLKKPHMDLLLAIGRFSLKISPPDIEAASRNFTQAYEIGQRKQLLFMLWFEAEMNRGAYSIAEDVATKALNESPQNISEWYEKRAHVHLALSRRDKSQYARDTYIREVDLAIDDLKLARQHATTHYEKKRVDGMIEQIFLSKSS